MSAREFYCPECRDWHPIDPAEGTIAARRHHAERHTADAELFASDELLALDVEFERLYGGVF